MLLYYTTIYIKNQYRLLFGTIYTSKYRYFCIHFTLLKLLLYGTITLTNKTNQNSRKEVMTYEYIF